MSEAKIKRNTQGGPMGNGPMGGGAVEKSKNFKTTMVKLLEYCKKYIPIIIIALIAAAAGTILQIIGPDKLKDLTNEIMKGLPAMINGKPVLGSIDMEVVSKIAWTLAIFYAISFPIKLRAKFDYGNCDSGYFKEDENGYLTKSKSTSVKIF